MRQVDDFAIAAPDQCTADILLDMLDDKLSMPVKCRGLLDMYNGIDVTQTRHYIKIDCHTYISKFCAKYLDSWLGSMFSMGSNSKLILQKNYTEINLFCR